jgi:hypothetical protein
MGNTPIESGKKDAKPITLGFVQVEQTEVQSTFCSLLGFGSGLTSIAEH